MEIDVDKLIEKYKQFINNIIKEDRKYFLFTKIPNWSFYADADINKIANFSKEEGLVKINLYACTNNDIQQIEYNYLHAVRRFFQYQMVDAYKEGKEISIKECYVKEWENDFNNCVSLYNNDGSVNEAYFFQAIELDAFVFSYAVMKHKYKDVKNLFVPKIYDQTFYDVVDKLVNYYNKKGLD